MELNTRARPSHCHLIKLNRIDLVKSQDHSIQEALKQSFTEAK